MDFESFGVCAWCCVVVGVVVFDVGVWCKVHSHDVYGTMAIVAILVGRDWGCGGAVLGIVTMGGVGGMVGIVGGVVDISVWCHLIDNYLVSATLDRIKYPEAHLAISCFCF